MRMSKHYKQLLEGVQELVKGRYRDDMKIHYRLQIIRIVLALKSEKGLKFVYDFAYAAMRGDEEVFAKEMEEAE
ncbi:hypothetical protein [Metasolibacillus meyeri]|uniref:hypothetical protein n=1 Tax=Metasolibacillus meyeri TaxID=1071052 RepID=UPI00128FE7B0|nr:hypothetical protein [Metasolibacillus meyeri]